MQTREQLLLLSILAGGAGALGCTAGPIDVASLPADSLANDLVAHWAFDEDMGGIVNDISGNGRTGLIMLPAGAVYGWIPNGEFNSAYHFSGIDDVTVGGVPRATPSYSVSAWALFMATELGPPLEDLLSTETPGGGWALYATLAVGHESYAFRYADNQPQGFEVVSCNCLVPGVWTHLAAVVDGDAATLTLYVNGVAQSVPTDSPIFPGSTILNMGRPSEPMPGTTWPLTGALDDVAIYSRALVAQEVAELATEPAPNLAQ